MSHDADAAITQQSSGLHDFFKFLTSIRGDLANITAPAFLLAPFSVVEVGGCWLERPSSFVAPAKERDPEKRSLLVLKWILSSLRSQLYLGGSSTNSVKKPLNAFLGETFLARFNDEQASVNLASEQVSHHPPVTAVYMWDDENGIRGEGYVRVEMTFSGSVSVRQTGHAIVHIDEYDEDYLIPFPNASIRGFFSGQLYPEITGTYHIISSSGYISEICFSGRGLFGGGERNAFKAVMYQKDDRDKTPLYTAFGQWSGQFTIKDARTEEIIERYDTATHATNTAEAIVAPLVQQDEWESRRAWNHCLSALKEGNYSRAIDEKSKLEMAQRQMRDQEKDSGHAWKPLLFRDSGEDDVFEALASSIGWELQPEKTRGVWKADRVKIKSLKRPFRPGTSPLNNQL